MQEKPQEPHFLPETIDEQIAQLKQEGQRDTADARLVRDLERAYHEERAEEQAIERIRERFLQRVTQTSSSDGQVMLPHAGRQELPHRTGREQQNTRARRAANHFWIRQWRGLAAALIVTLLTGSLVALFQIAHTNSQHGGKIVAQASPQAPFAPPATSQTDAGMYLEIGNQVVKVDVQTQHVLWRFVVKNDPHGLPAFTQTQVNQPPVVANETVYFTAHNGRLYALDAQTGTLRWQRNFQAAVGHIAFVNGVLYTDTSWSGAKGTINTVYALNPADGTIKTTFKAMGQMAGVFDGVIYLVGNDHTDRNILTALNVTDGKQLWQAQIDASQSFNPEVSVHNGFLYASSSQMNGQASNKPQESFVYTIDQASGKITWQSPRIDGVVSHIAVGDDGHIYCTAQNHSVSAFDPQGNTVLWTFHPMAGQVSLAPVVANGFVYVEQFETGGKEGNTDQLVALDAATGHLKWATPLQGTIGQDDGEPLVINNDVLYLSTTTGVHGFAADSGKQVVTIPTDALFSKKDAGANASVIAIAITMVS
jgi:outer membrane protein assembly factor BamB